MLGGLVLCAFRATNQDRPVKIGLCLPIGERGPERRATRYQEMRELALLAEHGNLDSIWVADHLFIVGGDEGRRGVWESMTMLGALAEATHRVEFGPLVLCTPFRNPGLIAWMANTLEEISGGRFVLGVGAGWHQPEFDGFGFEFDHKVSVFEDSLEVMVPLLREGKVDHDGKWAVAHVELRPRGPRPNGPPILIAGTRPRMMRLTAKWADRWNSVWYGLPTDEFRDERAGLDEALAAAGRDRSTIEVSVGVAVKDPRTIDRNDGESIRATIGDIAEALATWHEEGVDEVMCRMEPPSPDVVEVIADAATRYRASSNADPQLEVETASALGADD
jgi:alkanesulfonate monooxygenase SsuD/methylene tetrahydromethanopterin reductase-like flavin-dependent oxidoreductase (luciferase family)